MIRDGGSFGWGLEGTNGAALSGPLRPPWPPEGPVSSRPSPCPPGPCIPELLSRPVPSWCCLPRIQVDKAQPLPRSLPGSLPQSSTSRITAQI